MRYALVLLLLAGGPAMAQRVPEGIHRESDGTASLCGENAPTVEALEARIRSRFPLLETTDRFITYEDEPHYRLWSFTRRSHDAYPAVICRTVVEQDGNVSLAMEISCLSTRARCDALYREWEAHDARLLEGMRPPADPVT